MPTLENWSLGSVPENPYQAPELWAAVLYGEVYDHAKIKDRTLVQTSRVVNVKNRTVFTSSGSIYTLGIPSEDYIKWCEENEVATREQLTGPEPIKWNIE